MLPTSFRVLPLLLLITTLSACGKKDTPAAAPRVVAVIAPTPLSGLAGDAYPGSVRARIESQLSFRVAGKIIERRAEIGTHVSKGTVLALLDPQDARLNVSAAGANTAAAEADAKLAAAELKRYEDLAASGFVSPSLVDTYRTQLDLAKAKLAQAQSQNAIARNQAGYTSLVADADGTITSVLADAGQVVAAGTPVFGFARDGEREVVVAVPEGQTDMLTKASKLAITLWAVEGKVYEGRVREISASADPRTRTHEARVTILNPDDTVRLGMTANVLAGNTTSGQAFSLPSSALGDLKGAATVWIVKPGTPATAQPVPVKVLKYLNDAVIVAGALQADQKLISAGVQLLTPGMPVQALDRKAPVAL